MTNIKTKACILLQLVGILYSAVALILAFADNSSAMFMQGFAVLCITAVFHLVIEKENGNN